MAAKSRTITVEFFGIPRARAGVAETTIDLTNDSISFAAALAKLSERFPAFGAQCVVTDRLGDGFAANIHGERFLHSGADSIREGETLLIFSADAGG